MSKIRSVRSKISSVRSKIRSLQSQIRSVQKAVHSVQLHIRCVWLRERCANSGPQRAVLVVPSAALRRLQTASFPPSQPEDQLTDAMESLIEAAAQARRQAYAKYSNFAVGAALRATNGRVYVGCNVENISFGLTICAERNALAAAIAAGERSFEAIAVVSDSIEPVSPCGACRQVLAEFAPDLKILSVTTDGVMFEASLSELLPRPTTGILDRER